MADSDIIVNLHLVISFHFYGIDVQFKQLPDISIKRTRVIEFMRVSTKPQLKNASWGVN